MLTPEFVHLKIQKKKEDDKKKREELKQQTLNIETVILDDEDIDEEIIKYRPLRCENYVLPTFNIYESKAKGAEAKRRLKLSKILTFIKTVQKKRYKDGCTIIPIATTSKANCWLWGSVKNVSNAIKYMIEIGLIEVFNSYSQYNADNPNYNICKTYKYFVDNERKFIQYCEEHNIERYIPKCKVNIKLSKKVKEVCSVVEPKDVRFGTKLELVKPEGISKNDFEKYLERCLEQNYINFRFIKEKVDEMNERFYSDDINFSIRFKTNYDWNKKGTMVVGIGIRATNSYCNLEKSVRKKLLKEMGFNLEKDVRSSVPRLTLSLNSGHWINEDVDIYKLISDELYPGEVCSEERREGIKALHMSAYFDEGSYKYLGKNVYFRMDKVDVDKKEVDELIGKMKEAVIKVEGGNTFGNEIFYVESCIYLMTLYDLLCSKHKKVWLVYDSFYSIGDEDKEDYIYMIKEGIRINFNEFMEKVLGFDIKKVQG